MTIAELHGKLAPGQPSGVHERMEDLLTSDVFGTMKYAGWEHGFADWLLLAEPAPVEPPPPAISSYLTSGTIGAAGYRFWPRMANGRQPDVALLFEFAEEDPLLIVVEAKYMSGARDWSDDGERGRAGLTGNQIADQVRGLSEMTAQELGHWFEAAPAVGTLPAGTDARRVHLYVTTHAALPGRDYGQAHERLGSPWPLPAYWLSWTWLADCLSNHLEGPERCPRELIADLHRLLLRKGLAPFRGFRMEPWKGETKTASFWHEVWWALAPVDVGRYRSFWRDTWWAFFSIDPGPYTSSWTSLDSDSQLEGDGDE